MAVWPAPSQHLKSLNAAVYVRHLQRSNDTMQRGRYDSLGITRTPWHVPWNLNFVTAPFAIFRLIFSPSSKWPFPKQRPQHFGAFSLVHWTHMNPAMTLTFAGCLFSWGAKRVGSIVTQQIFCLYRQNACLLKLNALQQHTALSHDLWAFHNPHYVICCSALRAPSSPTHVLASARVSSVWPFSVFGLAT